MVSVPSDRLERLIPAIREACARGTTIVALTSWRPVLDVGLAPFLLHTIWADRIPELPLNATFALVPFHPPAQRMASEPLIEPETATLARYVARVDRNAQDRGLESDFVHPDWEEGYQKRKDSIHDRPLPGRAYVAVDQVRADGTIDAGYRPVLGRFAVRGTRHVPALRPRVLVPPRTITQAARDVLVSVDMLIADIQGCRGRRALEAVRSVLACRRGRPTLVVAASPSDLVALQVTDPSPDWAQVEIGEPVPPPQMRVVPVEPQRAQTEERFRFAVLEMRGADPEIDRIISLAVGAWWSAHQRIGGEIEEDISFRRLVMALDDLDARAPHLATSFGPLVDMLREVDRDTVRRQARMQALVQTINSCLNTGGSRRITIIVRDPQSRAAVAKQVAKQWDITIDELPIVGVTIQAPRAFVPADATDLVVHGYYGNGTIDDIFQSGTEAIALVMDPLETLAMNRGIHSMLSVAAPVSHVSHALIALEEAVQPYLPKWGGEPVDIGAFSTEPTLEQPLTAANSHGATRHITVAFTDGTSIDVGPSHRFEVFAPLSTRVDFRTPDRLEPGDEVVLAEAGDFSTRLLDALDGGVLSEHAQKRRGWLTLIAAMQERRGGSIAAVLTRLRYAGVHVDRNTVRNWLAGTSASATVPDSWPHFVAFAAAMGLELPEDVLEDLYRNIRILRIRHRQAGRELIRAMRGAATSRLTAASLHRIETTWGMSARELLAGTRLAVVDEVIQ